MTSAKGIGWYFQDLWHELTVLVQCRYRDTNAWCPYCERRARFQIFSAPSPALSVPLPALHVSMIPQCTSLSHRAP